MSLFSRFFPVFCAAWSKFILKEHLVLVHFYKGDASVCSEFITHACFLSFFVHFPALFTFWSPLDHLLKNWLLWLVSVGAARIKRDKPGNPRQHRMDGMLFFLCSLYCTRHAKLNTKEAFLPKTAAVWKNYSSLSQCLAQKKSHFKLERTDANMAARTKWCL